MKLKLALLALSVAACTLGLPGRAVAQDYPNKPVKVILPFVAGGGIDILGRLLATRLSEKWKQPVVVENKPGANGVIASQQLIASSPDGYTLSLLGVTHATNVFFQKKLPYDTVRDFTPINLLATTKYVLVANPQAKATTINEFVSLVRANPEKYSLGVSENSSRLVAELLKSRTGLTKLQIVPYKGGAAQMTDIMGGHVDFGVSSVSSTFALHKSGRIRNIAVVGNSRSETLKEIATTEEQGLTDMNAIFWFGLFGPPKMNPQLAERIARDFNAVLAEPDLRARLIELGIDPIGSVPADFVKRIDDDIKQYSDLIKRSNLNLTEE